MKLPIYLDNNATTPVDPAVLDAMLPYLTERFGNAGSKTHSFGWEAEEAVDRARRQVAQLIGARPKEIVFTSGATESDNLAVLGAALVHGPAKKHIITATTEHKAILDPCRHLEKQGFRVTRLSPDSDGVVSAGAVEQAISEDTFLVSLMFANNEIGTIHPIAEIGAVTRARGVLFHSDSAQGVGKVPVDVESLSVDLLSLTAHKIYGPKGIGALYVRQRPPKARIAPLLHGGGQESGLRPGTLSVPLIVGLGEACERAGATMESEIPRLGELSARLFEGLQEQIGGITLNGHPKERIPGNLHVSIPGVEANALLLGMPEVAFSAGAACTSASPEPSHVLAALGLPRERAFSAVRFGLGRFNREDEIEYTIQRVAAEVARLRRVRA